MNSFEAVDPRHESPLRQYTDHLIGMFAFYRKFLFLQIPRFCGLRMDSSVACGLLLSPHWDARSSSRRPAGPPRDYRRRRPLPGPLGKR